MLLLLLVVVVAGEVSAYINDYCLLLTPAYDDYSVVINSSYILTSS